MPVKGEVPWDIAEHTLAKHDIYRRYLERWFPILLNGANAFPSATYAEGFAGPGIYKSGDEGSPIIALKAYLDKVPAGKALTKFVFIDDDPRCVKILNEQLILHFPQRPRHEEELRVKVVEGKCVDVLGEQLTRHEAWGQPILAVLDSWGNGCYFEELLNSRTRSTNLLGLN
jgi:three-Cys-motif partner protein